MNHGSFISPGKVWPRRCTGLLALILLASLLLAAAAPGPSAPPSALPSPAPPAAQPAKTIPPGREEIAAAIAQWPAQIHRPFFATIHALGHRLTAQGWCDASSANDFRLIAATETGSILFDTTHDAQGSHVARIMPGLPKTVVETIGHDVALALRMPADLTNLKTHGSATTVKTKSPEGYSFTYTFENPNGAGTRATASNVDIGTFDTLEIRYTRYLETADPAGHLLDITLHRAIRGYTMDLSFTDAISEAK